MPIRSTFDTSSRLRAAAMSPLSNAPRGGLRIYLREATGAVVSSFGRAVIGRFYCGSEYKRARSRLVSPKAATFVTSLSLPKSTLANRSIGFISGRAGRGIFYRCEAGRTVPTGYIAISTARFCSSGNSATSVISHFTKPPTLVWAGIERSSKPHAVTSPSRRRSRVSENPTDPVTIGTGE